MSAITRPTKRAKTSPQLPDDVFRHIMSFVVDPYREDKKKHARVWQSIRIERVVENEGLDDVDEDDLDLPTFYCSAYLPEHLAIKSTRAMRDYMAETGDYFPLELPNYDPFEVDGKMWGEEKATFILDDTFVFQRRWNDVVYLQE